MMIRIYRNENTETLAPLCCKKTLQEIRMSGSILGELLLTRWEGAAKDLATMMTLSVPSAFWPSKTLLDELASSAGPFTLRDSDGADVAWMSGSEKPAPDARIVSVDSASFVIEHPWQLLRINEELLSEITKSDVRGEVKSAVYVDGVLVLGEGSVILPGVYIEGTAVIGRNCRIGPNCHIRGSTSIGDGCHIGQAVEVKNSILQDKVAIARLCYIGDTVIGSHVDIGAGTITSNFRHDGKNHLSMIMGRLVDTGRRKFGSIIGDNVHTGINTSIYPGRKIWADLETRPAEVVKYDLMNPR